ncbi:hypothetical protein QQ045_005915 [Rhodiola kirilowii]
MFFILTNRFYGFNIPSLIILHTTLSQLYNLILIVFFENNNGQCINNFSVPTYMGIHHCLFFLLLAMKHGNLYMGQVPVSETRKPPETVGNVNAGFRNDRRKLAARRQLLSSSLAISYRFRRSPSPVTACPARQSSSPVAARHGRCKKRKYGDQWKCVSRKGSFPCKSVTVEQIREMTRIHEEYEAKRTRMAPRAVPLPSGPSIFASSAQGNSYTSGPPNKRRGGSDLEKAFDNQARSELDCAIARMFYTSGLPFSLARNPNYFRCFTMAANSRLGGYVPPGYTRIRTTLLENEKKHLDLSLAKLKELLLYYSQEWLAEDSARKSPHADDEVLMERRKCFERLFPRLGDYDKVLTEYSLFSLGMGSFGDPNAIERRYTMDPGSWWVNFRTGAPLLQGLAIRLLGQPTSSSCAERNWSTCIHS